MRINNQIKAGYTSFKQALKRPEGPKEQITGKDVVNDLVLFAEGAADVGLSIGVPFASGVLLSRGQMNPVAFAGALMYGSEALRNGGNLVGNLTTKVTGSAKAGRIARTAAKVGLFVGGVAALSGSLGTGAIALAGCAVVYGGIQQLEDKLCGSARTEESNRSSAPSNLLDPNTPTEFDAPNLLNANAPLESDAPNLLETAAQSNRSLQALNSGASPRVLLQVTRVPVGTPVARRPRADPSVQD